MTSITLITQRIAPACPVDWQRSRAASDILCGSAATLALAAHGWDGTTQTVAMIHQCEPLWLHHSHYEDAP